MPQGRDPVFTILKAHVSEQHHDVSTDSVPPGGFHHLWPIGMHFIITGQNEIIFYLTWRQHFHFKKEEGTYFIPDMGN